MHVVNPKMTNRQKQIVYGTILGGSSIICPKQGKNCYLSMRDKNEKWLSFKAIELQNFASDNPFTSEKTTRWHSLCYPIFSEMREKFYSGEERKIDLQTLEDLRLYDIAFMVWYGDCGKTISEKVILNTYLWGLNGTKEIIKFLDLINFKANIFKEKNNLRIRLDEESSVRFRNLIMPHMPLFMHFNND